MGWVGDSPPFQFHSTHLVSVGGERKDRDEADRNFNLYSEIQSFCRIKKTFEKLFLAQEQIH